MTTVFSGLVYVVLLRKNINYIHLNNKGKHKYLVMTEKK